MRETHQSSKKINQEMHKKLIFKLNEVENIGQVEIVNSVINNLGYHVVRMCVMCRYSVSVLFSHSLSLDVVGFVSFSYFSAHNTHG
jgi:hypothetical protein